MGRVIDFYAESQPHPDWGRLRALDFEDDLQHLRQWFESVLMSEPPGPEITGLWFGLVNPYRGGRPTADMYVRGSTYDYKDEDWVLRTGWHPTASDARSRVLDAIYRIAYPPLDATGDSSPEVQEAYREAMKGLLGNTAEYSLALHTPDSSSAGSQTRSNGTSFSAMPQSAFSSRVSTTATGYAWGRSGPTALSSQRRASE